MKASIVLLAALCAEALAGPRYLNDKDRLSIGKGFGFDDISAGFDKLTGYGFGKEDRYGSIAKSFNPPRFRSGINFPTASKDSGYGSISRDFYRPNRGYGSIGRSVGKFGKDSGYGDVAPSSYHPSHGVRKDSGYGSVSRAYSVPSQGYGKGSNSVANYGTIVGGDRKNSGYGDIASGPHSSGLSSRGGSSYQGDPYTRSSDDHGTNNHGEKHRSTYSSMSRRSYRPKMAYYHERRKFPASFGGGYNGGVARSGYDFNQKNSGYDSPRGYKFPSSSAKAFGGKQRSGYGDVSIELYLPKSTYGV